jgi:CheY-like chemotaxis protein
MLETAPGGTCVLVVDDDDAVVAAVSEVLEDDGYGVLVAFGGDEAWMMIHKHAPLPDVVLLDLKMPAGDGWSLLRRLRQDARLAEIPVVVMSGGGASSLQMVSGAAGQLCKPVQLETLLETLRRALGDRGRGTPVTRGSYGAIPDCSYYDEYE